MKKIVLAGVVALALGGWQGVAMAERPDDKPAKQKQCSNTIDDDGDGFVDEGDAGCGSPNDNSEADEPTTEPEPAPELPVDPQDVLDQLPGAGDLPGLPEGLPGPGDLPAPPSDVPAPPSDVPAPPSDLPVDPQDVLDQLPSEDDVAALLENLPPTEVPPPPSA